MCSDCAPTLGDNDEKGTTLMVVYGKLPSQHPSFCFPEAWVVVMVENFFGEDTKAQTFSYMTTVIKTMKTL